jgi:hypothetical protein
MNGIVSVGLCLAGALTGAAAGMPAADAAETGWVRPSQAPLLDAAGEDSGCVATALKMYVYQDAKGEWRLGNADTLLCDRDYGHEVWRSGLFEILPDGTRVTVRPMGENIRGGPVTAGELQKLRTTQPCSFPGTHTFLARYKISVKVDVASTNPYSAIVEKVTTVTCPS